MRFHFRLGRRGERTCSCTGASGDKKSSAEKGGVQANVPESYLGVAVQPVPPVPAAQLPNLFSNDQGVVVAQVVPDSPAAKAGLKEHDVLVSYDDQKLYSTDQLIKLVRGDKPGREVALGVVRGGKLEKIKVAIGEGAAQFNLPMPGPRFGPRGPIRFWFNDAQDDRDEMPAPGGKAGKGNTRSNFLSMNLRSLDGDRYKAEIEYKDEQGEVKRWSFEGTRDEIRKELEAGKDIPAGIREHMLRSLDFSGGVGRRGAGLRLMMPRSGGGILMDNDEDGSGWFDFPGSFNIEEMLDRLPGDLDPQIRERLKGTFRSIEQPRKKPIVRDGAL